MKINIRLDVSDPCVQDQFVTEMEYISEQVNLAFIQSSNRGQSTTRHLLDTDDNVIGTVNVVVEDTDLAEAKDLEID